MRLLTWKRRALTIPVMLTGFALALVLAPLVLLVLATVDSVRRRWHYPKVRVFLFLLNYGLNDSIEILLAGPLWIMAGFGSRLNSVGSLNRHNGLQSWSIRTLARRVDQLLGVNIHISATDAKLLAQGGAVVLCRHVNLLDASLPSLLFGQHGVTSRGVIMAELLSDPGFDLIYQRTGSVFITRDGLTESISKLQILGRSINERSVAVIFPEGRLFRNNVLDARLERLKTTNPVRHSHLQNLRFSLPPRPAGFLEILRSSPNSDVVVINHVGFEDVGTFRQLAQQVPLNKTIDVTVSRYARHDLPHSDQELIEWLDQVWLSLDEHVQATVSSRDESTS